MQSLEQDDQPQREIQDKDVVECLESDVKFWTDFSKVHYHPQSLYELRGLWVDGLEFDNYGIGRDAFSSSLQGEEMNESLRFFVEECDHIQVGYNLISLRPNISFESKCRVHPCHFQLSLEKDTIEYDTI